jgi:predicted transcriptional regulator YdeE
MRLISFTAIGRMTMALILGEPRIVVREPYNVVGAYCTFEGDNEGPGWSGASRILDQRKHEIRNRKNDAVLGFLYRPHRDHPDIPENVRSCFMGVEVVNLDHVPAGLATTGFTGGEYVVMECKGDTQHEAAMGVVKAVGLLTQWMTQHGYREGDACSACSHENTATPPYRELVLRSEATSQSSICLHPDPEGSMTGNRSLPLLELPLHAAAQPLAMAESLAPALRLGISGTPHKRREGLYVRHHPNYKVPDKSKVK